MKRALIATLFNEADNVSRWWNCLVKQTVLPDEIVIVDGGSTDGTWEILRELASQAPVPVRLEQCRCNIAEGRNLAIKLTDAEIIASSDAGSFPDPTWFGELMRPLLENADNDLAGGRSVTMVENEFQVFLRNFESEHGDPSQENGTFSSSRNIAFRRQTWEAVGGYPEWLTLTGEDALFNSELHAVGKKFAPNINAVVRWPVRASAADYFKLHYRYGYGAAEAQLFSHHFLRCVALMFFPPLLLLSRHRFSHFLFRYRKNASGALGWLAGILKGRRPPPGWKKVNGVLLSPEALKARAENVN